MKKIQLTIIPVLILLLFINSVTVFATQAPADGATNPSVSGGIVDITGTTPTQALPAEQTDSSATDTENAENPEGTEGEQTPTAPLVEIGGGPSWPGGPQVASDSAVVMDYESGTIVYAKNPTVMHYPASITKVMTALVALENSNLNEQVKFSYNSVHSIEKGSSSISRDVDEVMTMEECIYGLLLESANECANAIAEHIGGSVDVFVEMMNKKAADLGCVNTHFVNPHGLHDDNHYTCAYDMALISREAYDNPTFALITGTKSYQIPPTNKHAEVTPLNNHHAMLNYYRTNKYLYEFCVGGKTGYTSKALSTLVTYGKKNNTTLIVVTMCAEGQNHYVDTTGLMNYYFANLQTVPIEELGERVTQVAGSSASRLMGNDEVPFEVDTKAAILLPVGANFDEVETKFIKENKGDNIIGKIAFTFDGKSVGEANIIGKDVPTYPFKNLMVTENQTEPKGYVVINVYKIALISVGVLFALLILVFTILRANNAIDLFRRRRIENRDPHKNMRRIKRRRKRRKEIR